MTFLQSPDYLTVKRLAQELGEDLKEETRRRIIDQVREASGRPMGPWGRRKPSEPQKHHVHLSHAYTTLGNTRRDANAA